MTLDDVIDVLSKCAAFDRRTIGEADALAWSEAIGDLNRTDALAAVTAWYRSHREFVMPSDIRSGAETIRAERLRDLPVEEITSDIPSEDTDAYQLTLKARTAAIADGCPVDQVKTAIPVIYPQAIGGAR